LLFGGNPVAELKPPRETLDFAQIVVLSTLLLVPLLLVGCGVASSGSTLESPLEAPATAPFNPDRQVVVDTVEAEDGLEISFDVRGAGEVALVFVHCWACDRSFWSEQLDVLAKDYRVVSLDLGGHGASGRDRDAWYLKDLAGDVEAVVEKLGLERVILVGHSMGAPISLAAAQGIGARMEGVVCVDSLHNAEVTITEQMVEAMAAAFENSFESTMNSFVRSAFPPTADEELVASVQERGRATNPEVSVQLLRDFPNMELAPLLSGAGVPVRCINSGNNPTKVEINQRYADFDAVILDGVGHFLMLEDPEAFNRALSEVLLELTQAAEPF